MYAICQDAALSHIYIRAPHYNERHLQDLDKNEV